MSVSTACDDAKRNVAGEPPNTSSSTAQRTTRPTAGTGPTHPTEPSRPSGSGEPSVPTAPTPTNRPPHKKPVEPAPRKIRTLRGQITEAVESGCLVLSTSEGTFTLIDPPGKLRTLDVGTEIVVRGTVPKGIATYCQQGTPFRVTSAHPA